MLKESLIQKMSYKELRRKYDKLKNEIKALENELETEIKDKIKTHNDKHTDLFIPDFKERNKQISIYQDETERRLKEAEK